MSKEKPLILLSAGGTGGHMTPAQALAHDLLSRGYDVEVITDPRGAKLASIFEGMKVRVLPSGTLGAGIMGKITGLTKLGLGVAKAMLLIKKLKPDVVVGFGGYPSVPAVYAAQKAGIPTIIHEQNAIMGRANAMLAGRTERIALSLPDVIGLDEADKIRAVITGNPVRADIADLYTQPYPSLNDKSPIRIFVIGGSLGAKVFSEVLPEAFSKLSAEHRARLHIVQQCREDTIEEVRKAYQDAGIKAELKTFFDDVAEQLKLCHLVIARSGASTVAEVTTAGRPAIFVPYPYNRDNQQKINADVVADMGGAWVMTESGFTPDALLARIETFLQNPENLFRAAENVRACGKPDAARKLGNLVTALASGWS